MQGLVELVWCGSAIAGGMIEDHVGCSTSYLLSYSCNLSYNNDAKLFFLDLLPRYLLDTDNLLPVLVFVTSFTSLVLLESTRPSNSKRTTGF